MPCSCRRSQSSPLVLANGAAFAASSGKGADYVRAFYAKANILDTILDFSMCVFLEFWNVRLWVMRPRALVHRAGGRNARTHPQDHRRGSGPEAARRSRAPSPLRSLYPARPPHTQPADGKIRLPDHLIRVEVGATAKCPDESRHPPSRSGLVIRRWPDPQAA
jgi:hypothetical protein